MKSKCLVRGFAFLLREIKPPDEIEKSDSMKLFSGFGF